MNWDRHQGKPIPRRHRENNLIIYGLPEESKRGVEVTLRRFFAMQLRVRVEFRKAIRIGSSVPGRPAPILVNLLSRDDKARIYSKSHLLKGTQVTIQDDLDQEQRKARKRKMAIREEMRERGRTSYFRGEYLYVDGRFFC